MNYKKETSDGAALTMLVIQIDDQALEASYWYAMQTGFIRDILMEKNKEQKRNRVKSACVTASDRNNRKLHVSLLCELLIDRTIGESI